MAQKPNPCPCRPSHLLQVNLFLAVLKVKFAKAQTIFMAKQAGREGGVVCRGGRGSVRGGWGRAAYLWTVVAGLWLPAAAEGAGLWRYPLAVSRPRM